MTSARSARRPIILIALVVIAVAIIAFVAFVPLGRTEPEGIRLRGSPLLDLPAPEIDLITLDVKGTVIERLDTIPEPMAAEEEEAEDEPVAGPIAIAVDVTESDEPAAADSPAAS